MSKWFLCDDDDPHVAELRILAKRDRVFMAQLLAHPDPRDPDHPIGPAGGDDADERYYQKQHGRIIMYEAMGENTNEDMTMYEVILIAEDGQYTLTDPMPERQALAWIKRNESRYGEGQRLALQYVEY